MILLRRSILISAVTGIVVFDKGYGTGLPGMVVGVVTDQPDAEAVAVPRIIASLIVLQPEEGGEVEYGTGCGQVSSACCRIPNPAALLGLLVPIILTD